MALCFLAGLVFITGGNIFGRGGYPLNVLYPDVEGLKPGAQVLVSGATSGSVVSISLKPQGVSVQLKIAPDVKIPADSTFSIGMGGLIAEPYVNIRRGHSSSYLQPGAVVTGSVPPSFDDMISDIRSSIQEIKKTFKNINTVLGDPETQRSLKAALNETPELVRSGTSAMKNVSGAAENISQLIAQTRGNISKTTANLAELSSNLNGFVGENRQTLTQSISDLSRILMRIDQFLAEFESDPNSVNGAGADVRRSIIKLGEAADQVGTLAHEIQSSLSSPSSQDGASDNPIRKIKDISARADRLLKSVEDISVKGRVGVHRVVSTGVDENDMLLDASLWVGKKSSPWAFAFGVEDVGDDGQTTVALGYGKEWGNLWGGVVRSHVGAGVLLNIWKGAFPLSGIYQWWDEDGGRWSAEGRLDLGKNWGIFYKRVKENPDDRESVGVSYRF